MNYGRVPFWLVGANCVMDSSSYGSQQETTTSSFHQRIDVDPKVQASLKDGMQVLQDLFTGVIQTFQNAVGEEWSKNALAAAWLGQAIACLQGIEQGWELGDFEQPHKLGELSCFLDRMKREIEGSRVEFQMDAIRSKLTQVVQMLVDKRCDTKLLREVLGYIQVALKSIEDTPASPSSSAFSAS